MPWMLKYRVQQQENVDDDDDRRDDHQNDEVNFGTNSSEVIDSLTRKIAELEEQLSRLQPASTSQNGITSQDDGGRGNTEKTQETLVVLCETASTMHSDNSFDTQNPEESKSSSSIHHPDEKESPVIAEECPKNSSSCHENSTLFSSPDGAIGRDVAPGLQEDLYLQNSHSWQDEAFMSQIGLSENEMDEFLGVLNDDVANISEIIK